MKRDPISSIFKIGFFCYWLKLLYIHDIWTVFIRKKRICREWFNLCCFWTFMGFLSCWGSHLLSAGILFKSILALCMWTKGTFWKLITCNRSFKLFQKFVTANVTIDNMAVNVQIVHFETFKFGSRFEFQVCKLNCNFHNALIKNSS